MPMLTSNEQVGVREDLSDLVYLADAKETPFLTMVKKGRTLTNIGLWEYQVKTRGGRKRGGVPDGQDVQAIDTPNKRAMIQARGEVYRRVPGVGFIAQIQSQKGQVAGVSNEFDLAVADQLVEHKRDMEREIWSNQDSQSDDGVNGLQQRGLGRYVYNGTNTLTLASDDPVQTTSGYAELPIPTAYRTPSAQIFTGSIAGMTEDDLGALIQAKWDNTGASSELRGFVTSAIKNRIGFFSRYQANVAGWTPAAYQMNGKRVDGATLFGATIDVYKSDWGTFTLYPVATDFMPTAYTGYFLDMDQIRLRQAVMADESELPNLGGGPRALIQSIISLEAGDPRAHSKIDGSA